MVVVNALTAHTRPSKSTTCALWSAKRYVSNRSRIVGSRGLRSLYWSRTHSKDLVVFPLGTRATNSYAPARTDRPYVAPIRALELIFWTALRILYTWHAKRPQRPNACIYPRRKSDSKSLPKTRSQTKRANALQDAPGIPRHLAKARSGCHPRQRQVAPTAPQPS